MSSKSKPNPLPLADTLRDLAFLRATDFDLSSVLPAVSLPSSTSVTENDVEESVKKSYEFVTEARAALKILNRQEVEKQGERLEGVRNRLEDVVAGLEGAEHCSP